MDKVFKQALKAKAHHLKPVILFGAKGLTSEIVAETDQALTAHELIKIKLSGVEREHKNSIIESLCDELKAELIQKIGHTVTLYRKNDSEDG